MINNCNMMMMKQSKLCFSTVHTPLGYMFPPPHSPPLGDSYAGRGAGGGSGDGPSVSGCSNLNLASTNPSAGGLIPDCPDSPPDQQTFCCCHYTSKTQRCRFRAESDPVPGITNNYIEITNCLTVGLVCLGHGVTSVLH